MSLINADFLLRYIVNYRVCWLGGRYGGGKTSLAFRLAYELMNTGKFRYCLSNVKSVWCDEVSSVELVGGRVDAVIILDEAGEFMSSRSQAKDWLAYLRKLNIVLLLPSVLPPSHDVRFLELRRTFNGFAVGVPAWFYSCSLSSGSIDEQIKFVWWSPSEIYGIYDTDGFPSDAIEILDAVKAWTKQSANEKGYKAPARSRSVLTFDESLTEQNSIVEDVAGEIDHFSEVSKQAQRTVSLLARRAGRR